MKRFDTQYRKWLDDCLQEYSAEFDPRDFHQETVPEDYDPGNFVEFGEDGTAYPHGMGGTNYIPNAVTRWEDSVHWVHWRA